jgi:hypothetical protein
MKKVLSANLKLFQWLDFIFDEWNTEIQVCRHMFAWIANKPRIDIVLNSTVDTENYKISINILQYILWVVMNNIQYLKYISGAAL